MAGVSFTGLCREAPRSAEARGGPKTVKAEMACPRGCHHNGVPCGSLEHQLQVKLKLTLFSSAPRLGS